MLSQEDIKLLIQAEKEVFTTKEDFARIEKMFTDLQTSVDGYAKKADAYFQEMVVLSNKVNRHEKWLQQIANKLGLNLEY